MQQLEGNVVFLNANQVITSLACGQLDEQLKKDMLVVGTKTNIVAHDIDRNVDLFFKEVSFEISFIDHRIFRFNANIEYFIFLQESRWCPCYHNW